MEIDVIFCTYQIAGGNVKIIDGKTEENSVPAEMLNGNLLPADANDKTSGSEFD